MIIDKNNTIFYGGRKMKILRTSSDAGSVRIGNDSFKILVPNGYGDGFTTVMIGEPGEERIIGADEKNFWSIVNGENFSVYYSDCGNDDEIVTTLSGKFCVYILGDTENYINKGAVAFIKSEYSN